MVDLNNFSRIWAQQIIRRNQGQIIRILSLAITWILASVVLTYNFQSTEISKKYGPIEDLSSRSTQQGYAHSAHSRVNASKLALIIEPHPIPHLLPQILHMMFILPPEWKFMFIGSKQSVMVVGRIFTIQHHIATGKLDLLTLPIPWNIETKEHVYRILADIRFYDEFLPEVEWLFLFGSNSIMCAQSTLSLDDWLEYSWAGAVSRINDNLLVSGGLTLRRVSFIKKVLSIYTRINNTEPEDEWFGKRIATIPASKIAMEIKGAQFSSENPSLHYPMGYYIRDGAFNVLSDWKVHEKRKATLEYCPELGIIIPMQLESEICVNDPSSNDKRAQTNRA